MRGKRGLWMDAFSDRKLCQFFGIYFGRDFAGLTLSEVSKAMVSCRTVYPCHARASIGLYKDAAGGSTVLDEEDCMRRFVFTALLSALWSPALLAAPVASKTR